MIEKTKINESGLVDSAKKTTDELFKAFWKTYPKKEGKKPAWDKFCRLTIEEQRQVVRHVQDRVEDDPKWLAGYVPMPTTFFNQQRWEDEYEPAKKKTEKSATQGKPQVMCDRCRSDKRTTRHRMICEEGMAYYDAQYGGVKYRLNVDGSGATEL